MKYSLAGNSCEITTRHRVVVSRVCHSLALATVFLAILSSGAVDTTWAQHPPGSIINNTAHATFGAGTHPTITADSNPVALTVVPTRSGSNVEFLRYVAGSRSGLATVYSGTDYSLSGEGDGPFQSLPNPVQLGGQSIDLTQPIPLAVAAIFFQSEPLFIRVTDEDQNRNAQIRDTILLTIENIELGDHELLRMFETGLNTGIFLGYIQTAGDPAQAKDGVLGVQQAQTATARYTDPYDNTDYATATGLFDPVSRVFDSRTGQALSGVTVRLVDHLTGAPANVMGTDGTSAFPASVTTGRPATDTAGAKYDFGPGGYRFPHVAVGQYRLELDVPPGYRAPTRFSDDILQQVPGGPFALHSASSRGEPFFVTGVPLLIDIPVDKVDTDLFVSKTAGKTSVAVGDFLSYEIRVTNATENDASDLTVVDDLPPGFRYQAGSTLIDGKPVADPSVSTDGRTLIFALGDLAQGTGFSIRYVLGVVPGAQVGDAINRATARWAQTVSNEATALVTVRRDLFGDTASIIGQVLGTDCETEDSTAGIAGVRVYVESGAFAVTDKQGRYHIAGLEPGAHLVQMDLESLPDQYVPGNCSTDSLHYEHPWSHLVDLQAGTMWRSDFRLQRVPAAIGTVHLELDTGLQGDQISGRLLLSSEVVPLRNLRLTVVLPSGTSYTPGSSRLGDKPLPDPQVDTGTLIYRLEDLAAEQAQTIWFTAAVNPPLRRTELAFKSMLMFDTPEAPNARTEVLQTTISLVPEVIRAEQPEMVLRPRFASLQADLSTADMAQIDTLLAELGDLDIIAVKVIGHTDSQRIRPGSPSGYADNHALSLARAKAVGDHIGQKLYLSEAQLSMYGMGAREPVADNSTAAGRARNRRVTLQVWTEKIVYVLPEQAVRDHERTQVQTQGFRPGENWPATTTTPTAATSMPAYDSDWLATADAGERILWPPHNHLPHLPALKLAVQHAASDSVHLILNDQPAGQLNFAGRTSDPSGSQAVSMWAGLDLIPGDNKIAVKIIDSRGRLVQHLERLVHYSGPPVFAELVPEKSVLVADGKTVPVIALRLTDSMGYPARRDVVGKFAVAAPHEAWREKTEQDRESITGLQEKSPNYTVGPGGVALLRLAPTTSSGEAVLSLGLLDHSEELRVWLQPQTRDWILAGVIEGTFGYNTVAGNLENLGHDERDDQFYSAGRLALFAKGRLKGKWLLTLAYDSQDPASDRQGGLFGVVDPDAYYTVYGDAVVQKHDAPTSDHLYIRLEREQFYALYGDFHAGLTMTEMSKYNRAMTGFRSSRRGQTLGFDVFASENRQNFRRDEIRGDGTSGLYRLSTGLVISHSEKIILQTRDRYRSEIIISERHLTRSVDYTLDDLDGTFFCKEPIPSQDENLNPVWLVATYETETGSRAEITAGGRGAWRPGNSTLEVGLTGIREGLQGGQGDVLAGVDTKWDLTPSIRLKGEYAGSKTRSNGRGEAWFGEASNRAGPVTGRVYLRNQEPRFGLGQQNTSEAGTRKFGGDLRWQQRQDWRVETTIFSQHNLVNHAERQFGELKAAHDNGRFTAGLGLRAVNDQPSTGGLKQSRQLTADTSVKLLKNKARVRISREQGLSGQDDLADFPSRTGLGLEYEVVRNQKIFITQEWLDSPGDRSDRTRIGIESMPWAGARITSATERRRRENERRVFANAGLKQSLRLSDDWYFDGSVDHGQSVSAAPDTATAAVTASDESFTAGSLGATYRTGLWLFDQRLEYRTSDSAEKWGMVGGVHVEPGRSLGLLASMRMIRTKYRLAGHHHLADVSLGLAWRPRNNPWTILQRISYRTEDKTGGPLPLSNWRIVNNLNVLRMFGQRDQISAQIGVRYNRDTIDGKEYSGVTDQLGMEWRHFIGSRWDIAARGSARHGWTADVLQYSAGLSGGYKLLEDIWLSLGYNFAGYHDRDFSAADYTAQGP